MVVPQGLPLRKSKFIQEDTMDKQEMDVTNTTTTTNEEPTSRPWVTPTFERTELKEALATAGGKGSDGTFSYS